MELILLLVAIYVLYKIFFSGSSSGGSSHGSTTNRSTTTRSRPQVPSRPPSKDTYRPTSSQKSSGIDFGAPQSPIRGFSQEDLQDLRDAFTGEKLEISKGIYRCEKCKVHYHTESYEVLRAENHGACVACGSTALVSLSSSTARTSSGKNYDPSTVTLANIRSHIGRVVTFEGYAHSVEVSRRGSDYAVMFEQKSWVNGFKLVFFKGAAQKVGGAAFITGLKGRTVKVRGLVVDHPKFGIEIIVSERSMIQSIK